MRWTKKTPTEPGYYWLRHEECEPGKEYIARLFYHKPPDDSRLYVQAFNSCWPLKEYVGETEWYGPLEIPK